jgi:hypothetical protein
MAITPPGGGDGRGRGDENGTGTRDAFGGDDDRTPNERPSGRHVANGAADGGVSGAAGAPPPDHGASIVSDFIAVGLSDLGDPSRGLLARLCDDEAGFRLDTERAGQLLRLVGPDVSRSYRVELRRKRKLIGQRRKLIEKLFLVCEIDLPPETP